MWLNRAQYRLPRKDNKKNSWRRDHPGFSASRSVPGSGFRYHDLVLTNARLISVKMEPHRFLCLPVRPESGFHIIDSDPHECVGIFVKTEPHRFLCLPVSAGIRFPILLIRIFTNVINVREDGITQVSLSPGQCRDQVSDIIDSDLHERRELFVKKEPHRFLCLPPPAGGRIRFPILLIRILTNV